MSNADVTIKGNVTADPELKFSNNGNAQLHISSIEPQLSGQRRMAKETSFFNVAWRKTPKMLPQF